MQELNLYTIMPSSYGEKGELLQYHKVLMHPPVFLVLESLIRRTKRTLDVKINACFINERLEKGETYLDSIKRNDLVFITAKAFELPRAIDIAVKLKKTGIRNIIMGGPGVTLTDWKTYQYLVREGISFNVGEGEETIPQIIANVLDNKLQPCYWQKEYVDISKAPLPCFPSRAEAEKTITKLAGIGSSEGCPFNCSYCTVTKIRGRESSKRRSRDPEAVVAWIEQAYHRGLPIMLTDDNLRRSFFYEELIEGLIKLNKKLNGKLQLFVQLDAANGVEKEAHKLARAGARQAFFGFESVVSSSLDDVGKKHNKPNYYKKIVSAFNAEGIFVNSGCMFGFPSQTPQEIIREAESFSKLVDLPHPYAVTPLPGSRDYEEAVAKRSLITWDPNWYDTVHCVNDWFDNMTVSEAQNAYNNVFCYLFSIKHILSGPPGLRMARLKSGLYGRILAELGRFRRDQPYHFMMDSLPRRTRVWRPKDSFCGFSLTAEDLRKKPGNFSPLFLPKLISPKHITFRA